MKDRSIFKVLIAIILLLLLVWVFCLACCEVMTLIFCDGLMQMEYAVKYSLLLAVPAAFGSTIISVVKLFGAGVNWAYVPAYLIGTAVALLTAVLSIGALLLLTKNGKFDSFRHYCWGAGVIAIFLTAIL